MRTGQFTSRWATPSSALRARYRCIAQGNVKHWPDRAEQAHLLEGKPGAVAKPALNGTAARRILVRDQLPGVGVAAGTFGVIAGTAGVAAGS
jgi:hypothetical protein